MLDTFDIVHYLEAHERTDKIYYSQITNYKKLSGVECYTNARRWITCHKSTKLLFAKPVSHFFSVVFGN